MIKAVLDSSVLTAAFLKHGGINYQVLLRGGTCYQLYLSRAILKETQRVLLHYKRIRKRYPYSDQDVKDFLDAIKEASEKVFARCPKVKIVKEDPKDNIILACALKAKADYIVSKDHHLTNLGEYRGIKIVSTDEFMKILETRAG